MGKELFICDQCPQVFITKVSFAAHKGQEITEGNFGLFHEFHLPKKQMNFFPNF
jgi:hypothetical protein